jgi:hypothetical protein
MCSDIDQRNGDGLVYMMMIPFVNQEKSTIGKTLLKAELISGILPVYW